MRVVFFIQNFSRAGGSERVTSMIASYLSAKGNDVTVISICGNNTCYFELDKGVNLRTLVNKPVVDNRKNFIRILSLLNYTYRKMRPDLVIDVFASLSIYTLLLKKKYKYKNISWEHYNFTVNLGMNKIGRKMAAKWSDAIVTLTQQDEELYKEGYKNHRAYITHIYNPTPYPNATSDTLKENIVLSVGRLSEEKGFDDLIRSWSMVKHNQMWKLVILGEGPERNLLEDIINNNHVSNVFLPGSVHNVDEYYKKAKLYVSTSKHEGLPMTMIEAQSFGLPIVSFDFYSGPKDIITDNVDGIIISGKNREEKTKKMSEVIDWLIDDESKMNDMGYQAIKNRSRFNMNCIGIQWDELIAMLFKAE